MAFKKGHPPMGGRPKGSTTRPKISDFITDEEFKQIMQKARDLALNGDKDMIKFIGEQRMGKAVQPIGNDGEEAFKVVGVDVVVRKAIDVQS